MSSLVIAVIGVGGIGSTFAFQLARAGHRVTVIARPGSSRLRQLKGEGGIVRTTGERVDVRVAGELDEATSYDLVLVTTLAHQVDAVLPALQRCKAKCVHFIFNTFEPERLRDAVGTHRCTFGMPFVMASVDRGGRVRSQINPAQKTLHSDLRWVALFEAAGIPSSYEADMLLWLRCHVPVCVSFESISVAAQRRGNGASWAEAMTVARGTRAGFAIIERLGYRLAHWLKQEGVKHSELFASHDGCGASRGARDRGARPGTSRRCA